MFGKDGSIERIVADIASYNIQVGKHGDAVVAGKMTTWLKLHERLIALTAGAWYSGGHGTVFVSEVSEMIIGIQLFFRPNTIVYLSYLTIRVRDT